MARAGRDGRSRGCADVIERIDDRNGELRAAGDTRRVAREEKAEVARSCWIAAMINRLQRDRSCTV